MKLQAPIEVEIKVGITNGEGQSGHATVTCGKGVFPTEKICVNFLKSVKLRLLNQACV